MDLWCQLYVSDNTANYSPHGKSLLHIMLQLNMTALEGEAF